MSKTAPHRFYASLGVFISIFYVFYKPSSQPPQYVPPSSKSNRPPFICGLVDAEFAEAFTAAVVDADPGEFGAIAAIRHEKNKPNKIII